MFFKSNKIFLAILFVACNATMIFSQQLQINSSGINMLPPGAGCNLQVVANASDPAIVPAWSFYGVLGTSSYPLWTESIYSLYYYNLYSMSDSTEKENITSLESVLNKVMNLRAVRFDYKADQSMVESARKNADRKNKIGIIAQELQNQFPEMVKQDSTTGKKRVNYVEMIPVLIKSMQELKAIVDQQDSTIADLTRKVNMK